MATHPTYRTAHGLTEEMKGHLARQGNVVLATINDDGSPHLTEVLFLLDEQDRIQMPTPHTTRKYKNLQERPVASAFFYDQPGGAWRTPRCFENPVQTVGGSQAGSQPDRGNQPPSGFHPSKA
jgi:hypothetical protein